MVLTTPFSQTRAQKRKVAFKRADAYVKEYLEKEREEIRLRRAARAAGDYYVPAQPKVYFVIRIKGWAFLPTFPLYLVFNSSYLQH